MLTTKKIAKWQERVDQAGTMAPAGAVKCLGDVLSEILADGRVIVKAREVAARDATPE
jgi:hypothetical protein